MRKRAAIALLALSAPLPGAGADSSDVVLKAMRDELAHSRALDGVNLEKPYFLSYTIEQGEAFTVSASLGGLLMSADAPFRYPRVQVRVGDYQFDNTNYAGGAGYGSRYDIDRFPLENLYPVLRRYLWLATDQTYKAAVDSLARKRAALNNNMSAREPIPDFARAQPVQVIDDLSRDELDHDAWRARVRTLSAIFAEFPQVLGSHLEMQAIKNVRYLVNSEGTEVRTGEDVLFLRVRGIGQAPDGMHVRDSAVIHAPDFAHPPAEADLAREVRLVAEDVSALSRAPTGDTYNGPVLFEGAAAAQLFAELLGKNLGLTRRPVNEPNRPNMALASELEGRQGARVLPEWMDVVDDPTRKQWQGHRLFGGYQVDYEGVIAKPLTMVEKGILKNFLLTRQPVVGFTGSNGRARLPGALGASTAAISNMIVTAAPSAQGKDLKKQLIEICQARNQPYGILVRKLDFPSSAPLDELRRQVAANAREGGGRPVSLPVLIYKVYKDGKEELIRGVRFRNLNVRSLRDIRSAGSDSNVFDYLENGLPLALLGAGSYAAETSVIAPSVLVDDLEVRKLDDELPKLPIVPSPLVAGK